MKFHLNLLMELCVGGQELACLGKIAIRLCMPGPLSEPAHKFLLRSPNPTSVEGKILPMKGLCHNAMTRITVLQTTGLSLPWWETQMGHSFGPLV